MKVSRKARSRRKPTLLGAVIRPLLGLVGIGLLWVAWKIDILEALARAFVAPLAPN